jgi:oxygen-independent coproporphyrinogen-3 oxidase
LPQEKEELTNTEQLNEYIMISLRTMEGLNLQRVEQQWGDDVKNKIVMGAQKHTAHNLILQQNNHLQLTQSGMLMADGIASDLFF